MNNHKKERRAKRGRERGKDTRNKKRGRGERPKGLRVSSEKKEELRM